MARVPTYDELQVAPRGLPGPQQSGVSPDAFGYAARQQATEAAAIDKAADVGVNLVVKMQEREDTDMLLRAEVAFHDELLQFETEAKKRKGADAKGLTQETDNFFNESRKKYVEGLANDRQRQAFIQRITPVRQSTMRSISGFEEKERISSLVEASEARTNIAVRTAAGNAHDWSVVDKERAEIGRQARVLQAEFKWSEEKYQDYLDSKLTPFHTQVMQELGSKPETRALTKKYFDKYEKDIPGDIRAELGARARKEAETSAIDATVESVTAKYRPAKAADPILYEDANKAIDSELKGSEPEVRAKAKSMFRDNMEQYKKQLEATETAQEASFHQAQMAGRSVAQIVATKEFKMLEDADATRAKRIYTNLLSFEHAKINRAAASASLADINERRRLNALDLQDRAFLRDNIDLYTSLRDPARIEQMTDRNRYLIEAKKFGPAHAAELMARYDSMHKDPRTLVAAKIDNDTFNTVATDAGLDPFGKSKSDKEMMANARKLVEAQIAQEQQAAGNKEIPPARKEQIAKDVLKRTIITSGFLGRNTETPLYELKGDKAKSVKVPPMFEQEMKRVHGAKATADYIRDAWIASPTKVKDEYKAWFDAGGRR